MTDNKLTILAGLDFSMLGDRALEGALEIVASHENAHLHVVNVGKASGDAVRLETDEGKKTLPLKEAQEFVQDYVTNLAARYEHGTVDPSRITAHIATGDAAEAIVQLAASLKVDEIFVGTHGRTGVRKLLAGSVAEAVLHSAHCTVVIVRPRAYGPEIEPAMTPEEKEVYKKFHQHFEGPHHVYHRSRGGGGLSGLVGGT